MSTEDEIERGIERDFAETKEKSHAIWERMRGLATTLAAQQRHVVAASYDFRATSIESFLTEAQSIAEMKRFPAALALPWTASAVWESLVEREAELQTHCKGVQDFVLGVSTSGVSEKLSKNTLLPREFLAHSLSVRGGAGEIFPQKANTTGLASSLLGSYDGVVDLLKQMDSFTRRGALVDYALSEEWERAEQIQNTLAAALTALEKGFRTRTQTPKSLSYNRQTALLTASALEAYREMECRYFLDARVAPLKRAIPVVNHESITPWAATLQRRWKIGKHTVALLEKARLATANRNLCASVDGGALISRVDAGVYVSSVNSSYADFRGSDDVVQFKSQAESALHPGNLTRAIDLDVIGETNEKLSAEQVTTRAKGNPYAILTGDAIDQATDLAIDYRLPLRGYMLRVDTSREISARLVKWDDWLTAQIAAGMGPGANLLPFDSLYLMPLPCLERGSGSQSLQDLVLHVGNDRCVRGPLLAETPKAFVNISSDLTSGVLLVSWDAMHFDRALGWERVSQARVPEPAYFDSKDPGAMVETEQGVYPPSTLCEYWNRLDWATDGSAIKRGGLTASKAIRAVVEAFHDTDDDSDRWNTRLLIRILQPGDACVLPKACMGYILLSLGAESVILEKSFVTAATLPSCLLRWTLPVDDTMSFPKYQPRSFSEAVLFDMLSSATVSDESFKKDLSTMVGNTHSRAAEKQKNADVEDDTESEQSSVLQSQPSFSSQCWGMPREFGPSSNVAAEFNRKNLILAKEMNWAYESKTRAGRLETFGNAWRMHESALFDAEWYANWYEADDAFSDPRANEILLLNVLLPHVVQSLVQCISRGDEFFLKGDSLVKLAVRGGRKETDEPPQGVTKKLFKERRFYETDDVRFYELVNYNGLWLKGHRVTVRCLEEETGKYRTLLDLFAIYEVFYPSSSAVIAGTEPGVRWICITGDQYINALRDELSVSMRIPRQFSALQQWLVEREVDADDGRGVFSWSTVARKLFGPMQSLRKNNSDFWITSRLVPSLLQANGTTEATAEVAIADAILYKLADNREFVRSLVVSECKNSIADSIDTELVEEAKTMLVALEEKSWEDSFLELHSVLPSVVLGALRAAASAEMARLVKEQQIPFKVFAPIKRRLAYWMPKMPQWEEESLDLFGLSRTVSEVEEEEPEQETETQTRHQYLRSLNEDTKLATLQQKADEGFSKYSTDDARPQNIGISTFLYRFPDSQAGFLRQVQEAFGSEEDRQEGFKGLKNAKDLTAEQKRVEKDLKKAHSEFLDAIKTSLEDIKRITEENGEAARPFVIRANALLDNTAAEALTQIVEIANTLDEANKRVSEKQ